MIIMKMTTIFAEDKFSNEIFYTVAVYEVQARLLRQTITQFKNMKETHCHISFVDNGLHVPRDFLELNLTYLSNTLKQNFRNSISTIYLNNSKTSPLLLAAFEYWHTTPHLNYENFKECDPLEIHIWFYYYFMRDLGYSEGTIENQKLYLDNHPEVFDFLPEYRINHHEKIDYPNITKDVVSLKTFCNGLVPIYLLQEILENEYPYFPLYKILALLSF